MKKALIVRFLIVIAIVMSVCVVSATALLSSTEQNVRKSDMLTSLGLIRVIYEDETDHDYDLANRLSSLVGNARVSFINKDGTVFVDTYIDGEPDDNHNSREEIKQAELTGSGVSVSAYPFTLHLRCGNSHMDCWFLQSALTLKRTVIYFFGNITLLQSVIQKF